MWTLPILVKSDFALGFGSHLTMNLGGAEDLGGGLVLTNLGVTDASAATWSWLVFGVDAVGVSDGHVSEGQDVASATEAVGVERFGVFAGADS